MTNWNKIHDEIADKSAVHDLTRRKYLKLLSEHTKRNTIIYYSAWLQKPNTSSLTVNDEDKTGFMSVVDGLNAQKGLDLFLHTPGGDTAATESLVTYLRSIFGKNIRVIVPELAMSAGTMIACASKEIVMGKHSSLGPIDPQYMGIPAHGILEEFKRAAEEIQTNPAAIHVWQPIIAKYNPTLIGECEKSIKWSEEMVSNWLKDCMFHEEERKDEIINNIIKELGDHSLTKSHARHLSIEKCKEIGLKIVDLESDPELRKLVLAVHHSAIHTLTATLANKIIENHEGTAFIKLSGEAIRQT
ncbi:S49 family peptidase [Candidatus Woesearchaeota archaeon]|nr:S49 family peptidase [Candidatus Woesearchaeota archaeon]